VPCPTKSEKQRQKTMDKGSKGGMAPPRPRPPPARWDSCLRFVRGGGGGVGWSGVDRPADAVQGGGGLPSLPIHQHPHTATLTGR
jgi:hypothetical protein